MKEQVSFETRFWSKVRKTETCWIWDTLFGYGEICVRGKKVKAHRISYEMTYGPIPDGMMIRHTCDVPQCVRPDHLLCGTQTDNMRDAAKRGRLMRGEDQTNSKLTEVDIIAIREEYATTTATCKELAKKYGVIRQTINYIVDGKTWSHLPVLEKIPRKTAVGERTSSAKLTDEQVIALRADRKTGMTHVALGKKYGIDPSTAGKIVQGKSWKHLQETSNDESPQPITT